MAIKIRRNLAHGLRAYVRGAGEMESKRPSATVGAPGRVCLGAARQVFGGFFPGLEGGFVGLVRCR